jgi:hypothetical protein
VNEATILNSTAHCFGLTRRRAAWDALPAYGREAVRRDGRRRLPWHVRRQAEHIAAGVRWAEAPTPLSAERNPFLNGKQRDTQFARTTPNLVSGASRRRVLQGAIGGAAGGLGLLAGRPAATAQVATPTATRAGVQPVVLAEGADALRREGLGATVAPWEDGLRETPRPGTLEWWYFDAEFDDGSALVLAYMTKPGITGSGELTPILNANLILPGAEPSNVLLPIAPEEFSASRDGCDVRIGPNWVRGELRRYDLHAETPEFSADLVYTGVLPPTRVGTGLVRYGEDGHAYLGWLVPMPRATVGGTLTIAGGTRAVRGTGYRDRNWGNVPFLDTLREWYWGRAYLGEYTIVFFELRTLPLYGEARVPMFILGRGDQILLATGQNAEMRIERERSDGRLLVPEQAAYVWSDGADQFRLELTTPRAMVQSPSQPTGSGSFLYQRFLAKATLRIDLGDLHEEVDGRALFEQALSM